MDAKAKAQALLPELSHALAYHLADEPAAARARELVRQAAPAERPALVGLVELAESFPQRLAEALRDPSLARDLVFCLGASQPVVRELKAAGHQWLDFFRAARAGHAGFGLVANAEALASAPNKEEAGRILGAAKRRVWAEIAIADLVGGAGVGQTMLRMSRLAEAAIASALGAAVRLVGLTRPPALKFCVMAMGKLGAEELNLSSDVDLFYLYDGPQPEQLLPAAVRLAETVTELLAAECLRVDLRLRPGGRNAHLAASLEGALGFYQSLGQTWERAALLRARPLAGARELGERLLRELAPFVYRRYLDFDMMRQLRAMKRRIETELRRPELKAQNIKLGYGGIREVEFIAQALVLVYAGRDPRLRCRGTVEAFERLSRLGYLDAGLAQRLGEAYLFLRNVEHKLQAAAGLQTHSLPKTEKGMRALAGRLGYGNDGRALERFVSELERRRRLIADEFAQMLARSELPPASVSQAAAAAWETALEPEQAALALGRLGFARPEESAEHLMLLARGPASAIAGPRRRELLTRLGPTLLDEAARLPDPDLALRNLAAFVAAVGARSSFLSLMEEQAATRAALMRLFASSAYLSGLFIRHPEMLDTLLRSDLAWPRRQREELADELAALLAACTESEERLDALRAFRHQEFLRIAIADLAGALALAGTQRELTLLAEEVLKAALAMTLAKTAEREPLPAGFEICVLAMGRLGAGEMTYNSDLDLIFVYRDPEESLSAGQQAARVAQRLIASLETPTREGYAYRLDLRLRPSGNAGPLVTSLEGFCNYHRQSSALWERQALVRGRVVAGSAALAELVEAARRDFVFGPGLDAAGVAEIAAMRMRMQRELGRETGRRLNIKQGPGGLVDVEFLAQTMALRAGPKLKAESPRRTADLIAAAASAGLITPEDAETLCPDYDFLARLENRLRMEHDQPAWAVPADPEALAPLARRMGYDGPNAGALLLDELRVRRQRIRALFTRYMTPPK